MKKFRLYWDDGHKEDQEADTIRQAFMELGYGGGAINALDHYREITTPEELKLAEEKEKGTKWE